MIEKIERAAREAGSIILAAHGEDLHIENKEGRANFVTLYDKKVQDFLTTRLKEILPDAKFLGEEMAWMLFFPGTMRGGCL
jgi:fructose-1,6-bisphosphatase/inositol monophosphatase family enzyme